MDSSHFEVLDFDSCFFKDFRFKRISFLTGFAYTYGFLCLTFSILTLIFKSETNKLKKVESNSGLPGNSFKSIAKAYLLIWKIFRLGPIKKLIIIQLTLRVR